MHALVPEGYNRVMPYMIIEGAEKFIEFSVTIFGAVEKMKVMRDETVVMHGEISIGDSVIMIADATEAHQVRTAGFFIYVADADDTYRRAIDAGAVAISPMADQQYGRSGGVTDPFGNTWWVTTAPGQ